MADLMLVLRELIDSMSIKFISTILIEDGTMMYSLAKMVATPGRGDIEDPSYVTIHDS